MAKRTVLASNRFRPRGVYERYGKLYTRDAEMAPANPDDLIARAGDDPIVKNTNEEDEGRSLPNGQRGAKEIVSRLPSGYTYALESAGGGEMLLIRMSSDDALDLGVTGTSNVASVGDRVHNTISAMNSKNRSMWARNAPKPR